MTTADLASRQPQIFPVLSPAQVQLASRFASGPAQTFQLGAKISDIGDRDVPVRLVLAGRLEAYKHDGLTRKALIVLVR